MKSHTCDQSGRYVVRLSFASLSIALHKTRRPAKRLLAAVEAKSKRNEHFGKLYRDFMAEYEALGHKKVVTNSTQLNSSACYLPHHGVLREFRTTTKLRVVFNGSQKIPHSQSLNSHFFESAAVTWKRPAELAAPPICNDCRH